MPVYQQLLHDPITHWLLGISVLLLMVDLVTGIVSSVHQRTFQLKRIGDILPHGVLPYLLILTMSLLGTLLQGYLLAALLLSIGTMLQNLIVLTSIVSNLGEWYALTETIPDPLWIAYQQHAHTLEGELPPWIARLDADADADADADTPSAPISMSDIPTQPSLPRVVVKGIHG